MKYEKGESGNPEGRPKGTKNKRTLIREALESVYDNGEAGFWLAVAEKAKDGDQSAVSLLAGRLVAPLKATDTPIVLDGLDSGTLTQKAEKIIGFMGSGDLSPSEAQGMITAITGLCRVQEIEDLNSRLEALERILKERK